MSESKISEINITPIENRSGLIGFASFVINNNFKVCNVGIYTCPSHPTGIRLTFPKKKYNQTELQTVYPINQTTYDCIVKAVAFKYNEVIDNLI